MSRMASRHGADRLGALLSTSELPNERLNLLYPVVVVVVGVLVVVGLLTTGHPASYRGALHPPAVSAPPGGTTGTTSPTSTAQANGSVSIPTIQGSEASVSAAALGTLKSAITSSTGSAPASVTEVAQTPTSLTCSVTTMNAQGQTVQTLVSVVRAGNGSWSVTNG